jgi:hypothetical protein
MKLNKDENEYKDTIKWTNKSLRIERIAPSFILVQSQTTL